MTNYLYSLSLAQQTGAFLLSLGFGFIMGIFYDLFRLIRISLSKGKIAYLIFDLLYCFFLGICSYLFFLTVNEGDVRGFLIAGEAIGFVIYYFSLGVVVFSFGERIIELFKRFFSKLLKIIITPFYRLFKLIGRFFSKIFQKAGLKGKKIKNKSKFLLKVYRHLLYNLNVKMVKNGVSEEKEV